MQVEHGQEALGAVTKPNHYQAIIDYVTKAAQPIDKYSHQPRLYRLACQLAEHASLNYDDEVLFAACWLHDLGVFIGHRPEDPVALAAWDNVAYAVKQVPVILSAVGFPADKIPAVQQAISQHLPENQPTAAEACLLHDADLLEQLGAIGILRTLCKVGRDTRYPTHGPALASLRRSLTLSRYLLMPEARELAAPKLALLEAFIRAADAEALGVPL